MIDHKIKPPLGLRPKCIALEHRQQEIIEAITRYMESGYIIPQIWIDEYNLISKELNDNPGIGII